MHYIIRTREYIGALYHTGQRGIIRKMYSRGRWQAEQVIAGECLENFTVHYENKTTYIFYQNTDGDVVSVTISDADTAVNSKVMLKHPTGHILPIMVYPVLSDEGLTIIYNAAGAEDGKDHLMTRRLDISGQWTTAARIDECLPGSLQIQRVTNDHLLLFYQTRTASVNMGYREITAKQTGEYNIYYASKFTPADMSHLTTGQGVHTLVVANGMFASQLIYRRNLSGTFDGPVVIYEAQHIENCSLFYVTGRLFITFQSAGILFICESGDNGASFSRPVRYTGKLSQNLLRAFFINGEAQSE